VRIERDGNQRWLVVNRPADKLWDAGARLLAGKRLQPGDRGPRLGIMETDWAENRAKLPQDIIRNTLGKVFDSLYSTGERDKFRTRLERGADGGTEIYITHRGMEEVYTSSPRTTTMWQPRRPTPSWKPNSCAA
jgi:outer membrane protein assembly factor BamC